MEFAPGMQEMRSAARQASSTLRLLANEDRLLLLCQLTHGERSVGELEQTLAIRQPTLSQQLGVLRHEGLVTTRRDGKRMFYSIADPRVLELLAILYKLYCARETTAVPACAAQQVQAAQGADQGRVHDAD